MPVYAPPHTHALFLIKPHVRRSTWPFIVRDVMLHVPADTRIMAMEQVRADMALLRRHYAHLQDKPFFLDVAEAMMAAPSLALWLHSRHHRLCRDLRYLIGATNPQQAKPWTLRARFGIDLTRNGFHASASSEEGAAEVALWFPQHNVAAHATRAVHDE